MDEGEEERLYRAHQPALDNVARFSGTPAPDREDVTQDTWLRVLQHRRSNAGSSPEERAWFRSITRNLARDRWRRNQRSARAHQRLASREEAASSTGGADEVFLTHVEGELVQQAFARLTEPQRRVLQLRVIEGLSAAEVGTRLGKEPAAVRQMQFRAVVALPYETVVPMTVPAVTPVWVVVMTSHLGGSASPLFYVAGTDRPGGARFSAVETGGAFEGIALSRFGIVHTLVLPRH